MAEHPEPACFCPLPLAHAELKANGTTCLLSRLSHASKNSIRSVDLLMSSIMMQVVGPTAVLEMGESKSARTGWNKSCKQLGRRVRTVGMAVKVAWRVPEVAMSGVLVELGGAPLLQDSEATAVVAAEVVESADEGEEEDGELGEDERDDVPGMV